MKLLKMLTYFKRKKRIANIIWQRVLKKYPNFPLYDRDTGKKRFRNPKLKIRVIEDYNPTTGDVVYKYFNYRLELKSDIKYEYCGKVCYEFEKNGKIIWHRDSSKYEYYLNK